MRALDRVEYLGARIEDLESVLVEEPPATARLPEVREHERTQTSTQWQVRGLQHERTNALRDAWRLWHERRVHLRRQVRTYESLAADSRARLQQLYTQKPPELPVPTYGPECKSGKVKEQ